MVGLFEERAVLLSKMGQHDQALMIYARKLNECASAEHYCDRIWQRRRDEHYRDVYLLLLKIYLQPPKDDADQDVMLRPAMRLLTKYGERIDAVKACLSSIICQIINRLCRYCQKQFQ
jgi:hypothetical protein